MKALVIYDSVFGNTEKIALAVGGALGSAENVQTLKVGSADPARLSGLDLLVVGSPTRQFKPTEGITTFLKNLPSDCLKGVKVASFDTRIDARTIKFFLFRYIVDHAGYACKSIAAGLVAKGGKLAAPGEGFIVKDSEGPLKEGELERAAQWAKML